MKTILVTLMIIGSAAAFGIDGTLDGKTFCRKVISDGLFGQPRDTRLHCLSFQDGRVTDNSNTFFGRPPESFTYDVDGVKIINIDTNELSGYEVIDRKIVIRETGAILEPVKGTVKH